MKSIIATTLLIFMSTKGYAQNCESIFIRNNVSFEEISNRAHFVSECIDQVSDISKAAYKASFKICENQVRYKDLHDTIILPNGETLRPSTQVESWEEFSLRIGGEANSSGCRDGILSGILNKGYFSKEKLLDIFAENEFALEAPFDGDYEFETSTIFGSIYSTANITYSKLWGNLIVEYSQLKKVGNKAFISNASFTTEGNLKGIFKAGPLVLRVNDPYVVTGHLSGYVDIKTQEVKFQSITVNSFDLKDGTLSDWGLEQVNIFANGNYFRDNLGDFWKAQLNDSYRRIDPFIFLKDNRNN